jgi:hypothetical protein
MMLAKTSPADAAALIAPMASKTPDWVQHVAAEGTVQDHRKAVALVVASVAVAVEHAPLMDEMLFPLTCMRCGAEMRIVAFITEATPVRRMLAHIGAST